VSQFPYTWSKGYATSTGSMPRSAQCGQDMQSERRIPPRACLPPLCALGAAPSANWVQMGRLRARLAWKNGLRCMIDDALELGDLWSEMRRCRRG
jgi:hypothetical protein